MTTQKINVAEVYAEFDQILEQFKSLLEDSDRPEAAGYCQKLIDESLAIRQAPLLRLAFIGQYSTGKSTIISALTGNRSIKIAADITTDKATPYMWNGVELLDTPGIGTERHDHDEITYTALERSDLLVFCITHMLLDSYIVQHFTKLAYEKRYSHKMMLVFNKLSAEAGDDDEKIANYRAGMNEALAPHSLDDFPVCFFDAKDYCEGVDEQDDDLIELSRFPSFIETLNSFVRKRGNLAQLDTPIRRVLGYAEVADSWFAQLPEQDAVFIETLNRLVRRVREERNQLRVEVKRLALDIHSKIRMVGSNFANDILTFENQEQLDKRKQEIEIKIEHFWNKAEQELQSIFEDSIESLQEEVSQILNSQFVSDFIAMLDYKQEIKSQPPLRGFNFDALRSQVAFLKKIGEELGINIQALAVRDYLKLPGSGEALRAMDVVGGPLYKGVRAVGKAVGFKFKPFGAVKIAKGIGDAARLVGPILGVIAMILHAAEIAEQEKQAQQVREVQGKIDSEFARIAREVDRQIHEQLKKFEEQTYDYVETQIKLQRETYCNQQTRNNSYAKQLAAIQTNLNNLIMKIQAFDS